MLFKTTYKFPGCNLHLFMLTIATVIFIIKSYGLVIIIYLLYAVVCNSHLMCVTA